jgi:hypothetical protein
VQEKGGGKQGKEKKQLENKQGGEIFLIDCE